MPIRLTACLTAVLLGVQPLVAQQIEGGDSHTDAIPAPAQPRVVISVSRAADIAPAGGRMIEILPSRPLPPTGGPDAEPGLRAVVPAAMPLFGSWVSSRFGRRFNPVTGMWGNHRGIDLAAPYGTPVAATADGVVAHSGWLGSYGIIVVLRHGSGIETRYAHLSAVAVTPGTTVRQGQVIGYVGSTGRSTGPHLHYEIRRGDQAIDPEQAWGR